MVHEHGVAKEASAHGISAVSRRDIFDYLRTAEFSWFGRMEEIAFLSRIYDLDTLPSTDRRCSTAAGDIFQHRANNYDWDDDWVFSDSRFQLTAGPDEILLEFLSQAVHPVVQADTAKAAQVVEDLNRLLAPDGWKLSASSQISGRPVYAPTHLGEGAGLALTFAHGAAARADTAYISKQVTRMEGAVDSDPELAIGTAKEFVETIYKTILDERREPYARGDDLPALVRKTVKVLKLTKDDVDSNAPAADTVRRMLMNLATLTQGSAELRNSYGTGHGKSSARQSRGLSGRHARLAVGAAATLGAFLYETYEERLQTAARDLRVPTPRQS